jgi:hypothetical protein
VKNNTLYSQRLNRILMAVALKKPDRTPVVLEYSGFAAYVTSTQMAEYLSSPTKNLDSMIQAFKMVGDGNAINYGSFWPYGLCYDYMSKVRVPGVDLPEDEMWQVVESELMTRDDYDLILSQGWPAYSKAFLTQRIFHEVPDEYLPPRRISPDAQKAWRQEGVPVLSGGEVVDAGLIALLHLDSNWTRELECFKELPMGRCIMALDGETDIFQAKKVLGDHMCIMGDVPASMLFLDTPDNVYAYCTRLIRKLGPEGFILQSGCDIPANAKLENVQAMVAAATGS